MNFGIIAAKTTVSEFRVTLSEAWPTMRIDASAERFDSAEQLWAWKDEHERCGTAEEWSEDNQGSEVFVLCQDGPWALFMDFSCIISGDAAALQKLSARFDSVLAFIVATESGSAHFSAYESGHLRRMIQRLDEELTLIGTALPQEQGIDLQHFYMKEVEQLMRAFGLSAPEHLPVVSTTLAIAVSDGADYSEAALSDREQGARKASSQDAKPWWKFW